LVFLAVGFGLVIDLPLQAASWLTFLALVITPGYLLGEMITWRLDLDLLERLALAMPLGVCVMALPGMVAMLAHLTIDELATAWTLTVGGLIIAWLFHLLLLRQGSFPSRRYPWSWDEVALLLLLVAAFVYIYPTLSLYKMDGDAYAVASFTADALTGRPLNATEPILGTGRSLGSIRMGFNQTLPIFHLWSFLSGEDHIELIGTASRSMLAVWAILAAYMLGAAGASSLTAGDGTSLGRRRLGLLTASIQMLVYLAAPFFRSDHVGIFFFERINADKFTVTVTMLPVVCALAIRYVGSRRRSAWLARDVWLAAALSAFAVSSIHALIAAMLALALGAFGGLHLLLNLRHREAWVRALGIAGLIVIVMILPLVQLFEARNGEALAPTYPSSLEGWPIEERLVPVLPFRLMPSLDVYGPLPNLAYLDAEQANTPTNPFLIWRFALNMRRQRIIVFDLERYISDPTIILEPPYLLGLLLLPLLLWRLRSHLGAQFALSTSLAILFVLFNPVLTPILGSLVMPWILWRFVWLLPYALIIALAVDRLLGALVWVMTRLPGLRSGRTVLLGIASLAFVIVSALLLRHNVLTNLEQLQARGAAPFVYATPGKIMARLQEETADGDPVMVMTDGNLSVTVPAFVGNADIVAHRILSTAEMFPADQQDLALERHIDQYNFLNTPLLTPAHIDILQRYSIGYVVIPDGTRLDAQLQLSPQWFEWLEAEEGYNLYAVRQLPTITEGSHGSIQGNAAFLERRWETAREHYLSAMRQDPSDLLALLGLADIYRVGGEFEEALATLKEALTEAEANSPAKSEFAPVLHYRLGQVYADMGQVESSIGEFDLAQQGAPSVLQFRVALADACLSAGHSECAQEQFEAAVDTMGQADEHQRLVTLAGIWQQRARDDMALPLYKRAAAIRPDGGTRLVLADAYRRAEQFDKAENLLYTLRQAYPLFVDADMHLRIVSAMARLRANQGKIDQAVALYRRATWLQAMLARDTRITRLSLVQALLEADGDGQGDRSVQARSEIERVLSLQPHNATAYVLLGNLYRAQYEPTMAMEAYQYALQLDPTEAAAYTSLSDQHRQQAAAPDETVALMQKGVEFNPEQAILALTLADQFRRLGDVEMAITTYQQALGWFESDMESFSLGPQPVRRTRALAYSRLAALFQDLGQVDTAMNFYQAAVTAAPNQPWTWVTLGDALRRQDQAVAAEDAYRAAIQEDPAQVDAYLRLASLLSDRGETLAALELYDQALQAALAGSNAAQTSRAWLALGSFYSQSPGTDVPLGSDVEPVVDVGSGDPVSQRALAAYYRALEAEESVAGVRALARLHQDLGQTEEAIQLFQQKIQLGEQDRWVPSLLAQYYVGLGDVYLEDGQRDQAIAAFERAVDLDGWWSGARLALARVHTEQGELDNALVEIRRAVEMAPGSVEAQLALADALDQQGKGEQSLAVYRATAQAHPGSAPANLALARAWQDRSRWDLAEQSYLQAMAMVPGEAEAYPGLANLLVLQVRYDEAEALLHKAIQLDRNNVVAYLRLGDLLARQARHAEALGAYQQAADLSSRNDSEAVVATYGGQARVHRALGEIEQAEAVLREALAMEETTLAPYLQLAGLYQEQDEPDRAEKTLLLALERFPGDVAVRQTLAEFYQSMGRGDEGLRQLRLAVDENPNSMVVLVSYANQLRLQGRTEEAEEIYRQAEEADETSGAGYRALAAARQAQGRWDEALALLDRAIAHDPEDTGNWIQQGRLHMQLYEQSAEHEAVASIARATDLAPAEGRTWYALGDTQLAAGRGQEAVAALEQAITVEATYLPAYGALVEAYQELGQREQITRTLMLAQSVVPGSHLGHMYHARVLESMELWEQARTALKQAMANAPGLPEAYVAMGQIDQRQGNNEEAASWYQRAIDLRPGDLSAYPNLIDLLLSQGDNLGALDLTQKALEKRPGDGDLLLRLGRVQRVLGRYAEAESSMLSAAQLDPIDDTIQAELALVYLAQGSAEEAIAAYERAIALRPDQAAHHLGVSQVWTAQGRPEHALSLLGDALLKVSRPAPLYVAMSNLHLGRGDPALALDILEQGTEELGEDSQLLQAVGAFHQSQADFDQAEEIYHQAAKLYADEAASHLALGGAHLSRGRAAEAVAEYEQAVALDALDSNAHLALGNAHRLMGQTQKAIAAYSQALALASRLEGAYIALASVYGSQARWQDAQEVYESGLAVVPTSGSLLSAYSDLLFQLGDEDGALDLLDRAVRLSPSARTYVARAALYRVLGRSADAQRDLEAARQIEPGSVEALIALGSLYRSQGKAAEAEGAYRQASSLEPGAAAPYMGLADLAYEQGKVDEAWWQFEAASQAEPASPEPAIGLAVARTSRGDWEEAEAAYRQAIDLDPTTTAAYLGLADVLQRRSGDLADALEWLQQANGPGISRGAVYRAIGEMCQTAPTAAGCSPGLTEDYLQQSVQLDPASPEGYLALADHYLAEGRPKEAERYAKLALEIAPRDPGVRISLGNIHHALGDLSAAESRYREAISLDATRLDEYTSLAGLFVAQERFSDAVSVYEEAISLAPLDWTLWVSLGNVYVEMEKYDDALSAYERAAEMNASVPEPWLLQGDVYVTKKKWKSAQAAYEQAQMLRPNQADPLLRLASLFEEREKLDRVKSYSRQAIKVDPGAVAGYVTLGRALQEQDKTGKAADALLTAIQLDPRRLAAYDRWMWCYTDIKRQPYSVDRSRLEAELAKLAKSEEAGSLWAQVLLGLGYQTLEKDTEQVIAHLEEAIRLDPAFVELYQELALLYEQSLDGSRALEWWHRYLYATARSSDTSEAQKHIESLLQVQIEEPADGDRVSGSVEIIGTATGEDFGSYKVTYSAPGSPDSWSTIGEGKSKVENDRLITWNTVGLSPGEYLVRLSVVDDDGKDLPYDEIAVEIESPG
jgi:tetratricopeptide (TPR) repeat protein